MRACVRACMRACLRACEKLDRERGLRVFASALRDENPFLENASEQFGGSGTTEPARVPADFGIGERFADSLGSTVSSLAESRSSFSLCTQCASACFTASSPSSFFSTFPTSTRLSLFLSLLVSPPRASPLCQWPCRVVATNK